MLVNKQLISVSQFSSIIEKMSNFLNNFNIIIQILSLIFEFVKNFKVSQNGCAAEFHNIYFHPEKNETKRLELYRSKQVEIFPEVFERENQGNTSISQNCSHPTFIGREYYHGSDSQERGGIKQRESLWFYCRCRQS